MRRVHLSAGPGHDLGPASPDLGLALEQLADEGRPAEALPGLLRQVEELAPATGAVEAILEAEPAPAALAKIATAAGYELTRTTLQLRRSLPLAPEVVARSLGAGPGPGASGMRSFRPGHDEGGWVRVNNRAFAWHPDQSGWTVEDLERKEAEPWFRADGFVVHESAGEPGPPTLDGFCWTKIHADTHPPLGEIFVIGVDPDAHGHGLGRALVVAGLDWLAGQGLADAMLYVEADNAAAVGLYRDLGFTEHQARRWWRRVLTP